MQSGPETATISHDNHFEPLQRKTLESLIAADEVAYLKHDVGKVENGHAVTSEALLREALYFRDSGYLKDAAQKLEKSGDAKVIYGTNGDIEHIVFNGSDGKAPLDIDLQHEFVNGKSVTQLRQLAVKDAKEFAAALLSDPRLTDGSRNLLSPEGRTAANALFDALLDGDTTAMTKAGQQIMHNPDMAKVVEDILNRIQSATTISFKIAPNGQPYMQARGGSDAVIVPASGPAYAIGVDVNDLPDYSRNPSLDTAMKSASDWSRAQTSRMIDAAEDYLELRQRLPAGGYANMKDLERAL